MTRSCFIICVIFIMALYTPVPAQLIGDANCNGWAWEIADAVFVAHFIVNPCNTYLPYCWENSDLDGDRRALTVGDIIYYLYYSHNPPNYPRHPESDTLTVESAVTFPGETITLPIWISTIDIIMGFQFLLEMNTDYLEFDTLIADDNFQLIFSDCDGHIYCVTHHPPFYPVIYEPGNYHVCDLILTVNPDINEPVTTPLLFSSCPPLALFSGFANSDFFLPVMVDAEIQILPLTDAESEVEITPSGFEISVYPNPFNEAVNISVSAEHPVQISIYDIMGRPVRSFAINAGNNLVKWDATDESGESLSAGIYFIGESQVRSFMKVLYLK